MISQIFATNLAVMGVAVLFVLPSVIGVAREVPHVGPVIIVNLLLGATGVGWVVALAMACRSRAISVRTSP